MRVLILVLSSVLVGCGGVGLEAMPDEVVPGTADPTADDAGVAAAATTGDLGGELFVIHRAGLEVVDPPGLDTMLDQVLDRDVLFYVAAEESTRIRIDLALAGTTGAQDPCATVVELPTADWSHNPVFEVGPGRLEVPISGALTTFRDLTLTGTFAEDGTSWSDGEMSAELDARELAAAVPEGTDVCGLVEAMGGACHACDDGAKTCFTLAFDHVGGEKVGLEFDPTPVCAA